RALLAGMVDKCRHIETERLPAIAGRIFGAAGLAVAAGVVKQQPDPFTDVVERAFEGVHLFDRAHEPVAKNDQRPVASEAEAEPITVDLCKFVSHEWPGSSLAGRRVSVVKGR